MTFLVVALAAATTLLWLRAARHWWRSKHRHTPLWERDHRYRQLGAIVEHDQVRL